MSMRVGLVVDSACDLPPEFFQEHKIEILPITIRLGLEEFVDRRDVQATLDFYSRHLANADGETAPFSVEQIKDLFLERLVLEYDFVFCLTVASSRSPIFDNATQASLQILNGYKPIRAQAGLTSPFALRVIDTQNLFAAQGVLAVEVARLIGEGQPPNRIRERLDSLIPALYMYGLPSDLYHLRARAQKTGDRSVGWFKYAIGTALDFKPLIRAHRGETGTVDSLRHFEEGLAALLPVPERPHARRSAHADRVPELLRSAGKADRAARLQGHAGLRPRAERGGLHQRGQHHRGGQRGRGRAELRLLRAAA